jgi:N-methylhydantoinase A/oxoprolinase/acetone carboxylase beta subunit
MTLALGVDTGGTFTDAVLIHDGKTVIAKGKSLTTRQDLAIGVDGAVRAVMAAANVTGDQIGFAALSTTLATNALVEGQGGSVGLIYIGFRHEDLDKHGLREALRGDPAVVLDGGHGHSGLQVAPLDTDGLRDWLMGAGAGLTGYAIAAKFGTRNPAHEQAAAALVKQITGAPVTCSHELSAQLNGPRRALTAVLNARLIGMIDRLITRAGEGLAALGVAAPMMVVRGDGALMSADQARDKPIETILSGPAASLVGAAWLTKADHAMVSDIGGTTTDVGLMINGRPAMDPAGARVGGFQTMVQAVAMRTTGLGGDSEVRVQAQGLNGGVLLGPRRLVPVALIASEHPEMVHRALDTQLGAVAPTELDGRFLRPVDGMPRAGLLEKDAELLARMGNSPHPANEILRNRRDYGTLDRLVARGLVQICGVTPTDAVHVVGNHRSWDSDASQKALTLLARRRAGHGDTIAADAQAMARMILDQMTEQTSQILLETALAEEGDPLTDDPTSLAGHPMLRAALAGRRGLVSMQAKLDVDVIGLGASARVHYPAVGDMLNCAMHVPDDADVANAIGAVVGQIALRRSGTVTAPSEGVVRAHLDDGPQDFTTAAAAIAATEAHLSAQAQAEAIAAGAEGVSVRFIRDVRTAQVEGREVFVEAEITAEATGRPRFADG